MASDRVCPYLGSLGGMETYLPYASTQNRCYAGGDSRGITSERQAGYCLGGKYATCPIFISAAYPREVAAPVRPITLTPTPAKPSGRRSVSRALSILLIILGLVLIGSGGVMAFQYQSKIGKPPPTPPPSSTATAVVAQWQVETATATSTPTSPPTHTPAATPTPVASTSAYTTSGGSLVVPATATPTLAPTPTLLPSPTTGPATFDPPETGGESPDMAEVAVRDGPSRIVIDAIGLDSKIVPVGWHIENYNGVEVGVWDVADYVVGWHVNSAIPGEPGNIVLSGHHNIKGEVFRYVVNLEPGDAVTVYQGDTPHHYRVQEKFILRDKGLSEAEREENAKWIGPFADERVTLVTCWPYTNNTHRVIVIAKPVEESQ